MRTAPVRAGRRAMKRAPLVETEGPPLCEERMGKKRFIHTVSVAIPSLFLAACGAQKPAAPPSVPMSDQTMNEALKYMPLEADTVFTYDTQSEGRPEHGLLIVQVSRPREGRADLRMGSKTERLQIEQDGIAHVEGGYLLKPPFVMGATWRSKSGNVKVVAVDELVKVPAGEFTGCIRTVEESHVGGAARVATSVFCSHVGLVSLEVTGGSEDAPGRETAILKSFGPRVNLTSTDVTTTTQDLTKQE